MKTRYEYIEFVMTEQKPKTSVWNCSNVKSGNVLGIIKWYSGWRRYCYFPTIQAVYSAGCLEDIFNFIKQLMEERKKDA